MLTSSDRSALLDRLAAGADKISAAWRDLPPAARAWHPGPGAWSAHEILCHCADAEANGYARIRFLVAEVNPVIRAFDENRWAQAVAYHALPAETALSVVEALRAHTDALVRRLPETAWERAGTHTETGRYTAAQWLRINVEHLEAHATQIESNQNRWWAAGAPASSASAPAPALAQPERSAHERSASIEQYAAGAARLRAAWAAVPPEARHWRPAPGEWSAHEVVCHTADSETNAYTRIRFLLAQDDPVIQGYDQEHWVSALDYAALPAESAMAAVEAVRSHTAAFIRRLPEVAWRRAGTHSESGPYSGDDWLHIYSTHLDDHARQIEENVASFRRQQS
jgi:uncharacterized damage-inducible protein DinB